MDRTQGRIVVAILLAISTFPSVGAEFKDASLIILDVHLNGRGPYPLLLDTGATTTMVDTSVASDLGLIPTSSLSIVTASGATRAPVATIEELAIGAFGVRSLRVSWMPMTALRSADARLAGVLGSDVLARVTVLIDNIAGRVFLARDGTCAGDALTLQWADGRPMVSLREHAAPDSQVRLVLDSASNALVLFRDVPASGFATSMETLHGSTRGRIGVLPLVVAGTTWNMPAFFTGANATREEDGLLPTALFDRVCIDGPRATAVLGRPLSACGMPTCQGRTPAEGHNRGRRR